MGSGRGTRAALFPPKFEDLGRAICFAARVKGRRKGGERAGGRSDGGDAANCPRFQRVGRLDEERACLAVCLRLRSCFCVRLLLQFACVYFECLCSVCVRACKLRHRGTVALSTQEEGQHLTTGARLDWLLCWAESGRKRVNEHGWRVRHRSQARFVFEVAVLPDALFWSDTGRSIPSHSALLLLLQTNCLLPRAPCLLTWAISLGRHGPSRACVRLSVSPLFAAPPAPSTLLHPGGVVRTPYGRWRCLALSPVGERGRRRERVGTPRARGRGGWPNGGPLGCRLFQEQVVVTRKERGEMAAPRSAAKTDGRSGQWGAAAAYACACICAPWRKWGGAPVSCIRVHGERARWAFSQQARSSFLPDGRVFPGRGRIAAVRGYR